MIFKAARLVDYHHVERPIIAVIVDQPFHILTIYDPDVTRRIKRP